MIARDGKLTSLWQQVPEYITTNTPLAGKVYDVCIAGGGITGITTALLLQKAGKECILLEANNLCFGSTGGTTAHLNTLLDTPYTTIENNFGEDNAKLVAKATAEAIELVKANVKEYSIDCDFEEVDAYLFSQSQQETKELHKIYEASAAAGLQVDFTHNIPVSINFDKALQVKQQAKLHPTKYVHALAKAFEDAGGIIVQQSRLMKAEEKEIITITAASGNYQAKNLVYATHIPPGINLLHLRCAPYRSYAMAVTLQDGETYPDGLVYDSCTPFHYYRTQKIDGTNYLIAGGEDHKTGHEDNTQKCFLHLEAHIRKNFKVAEISYQWSSQYFEPADGLPYIGHLPGHADNIFVATGFSGNGITYGHVAAQVIKSLLLKEDNEYSDLFKPGRIKPVAGFTHFIKENADVAKEFFTGCFSADKIQQLASLAHGEGKVVKYEGQSIGLYKDENGSLHAVNPTCTHMKCTVEWNNTEKSWDCPCHGGRFTCDGKVLTGPVDRDLEIIKLEELVEEKAEEN